jgi:polyketide synthase 12
MGGVGVRPLSTTDGLALFDAAVGMAGPTSLPMRLDVSALRARAELLPPLLSGLIRGPARRVAAAAGDGGAGLVRRLAGLSPSERESILMDLVRANVATVLGHASADAVPAAKAFKELGFDSLTAVELRNRLNAASGLRLPVTVVFDHPTPAALAEHLGGELVPDAADQLDTAELHIREAIAAVPLDRLRDAGVLDILLGLAGLDDATAAAPRDEPADLDELDAQSLVRVAFQQSQS